MAGSGLFWIVERKVGLEGRETPISTEVNVSPTASHRASEIVPAFFVFGSTPQTR